MTKKLPESIQKEVQYHLNNNDPESAKLAYDQWTMKSHKENPDYKEELISTRIHDDHTDLF